MSELSKAYAWARADQYWSNIHGFAFVISPRDYYQLLNANGIRHHETGRTFFGTEPTSFYFKGVPVVPLWVVRHGNVWIVPNIKQEKIKDGK